MWNSTPHSLYVHIPFCVKKCDYCDFYSRPVSYWLQNKFLSALEEEVRLRAKDAGPLRTVYIGGGTPTSLSLKSLRRLFEIIRAGFDVTRVAEWTIEANPGTVNKKKIDILRGGGVNRVSLGVQSFQENNLKILGRIHNVADVLHSVKLIRDAGFKRLSLDLISGVPGSTTQSWREDLMRAIELQPEHISAYCLSYENGTKLKEKVLNGVINSLSEDEEAAMYQESITLLGENGYTQYEISNYAKRGEESIHNMVYWDNDSYLGLGPAAVSYVNGTRMTNNHSLKDYIASPPAADFAETLSPLARAGETAIMNLRLRRGVIEKDFFDHTGFQFAEIFKDAIARNLDFGFLDKTSNGFRLALKALPVADTVLADFVIIDA